MRGSPYRPISATLSSLLSLGQWPRANVLSCAWEPLKRFWSPGRPPLLSYCQKVQNDHPAGSEPASAESWRAIYSAWSEAKARLPPVHVFHQWVVV